MQGFDYDKARTALNIPDDFQVEAMAVIGRPGGKEDLAQGPGTRNPNDRRKLNETVFEGPYRPA